MDIENSINKCDICFKLFSKKKNLNRHMQLHSTDKKFMCSYVGCNKSYSRSDHLKRHQISHTDNTKPYNCDYCIVRFSNKDHLKRHIKTIHNSEENEFHTNKNNNAYNLCTTSLNSNSSTINNNFVKRKKIHKELVTCIFPNCRKQFTTRNKLNHHIKRSHDRLSKLSRISFIGNGMKKASYILNPSKFKGKNKNKTNHNLISFHNNNKLYYLCHHQDCNKAYSTRYNLKVHIKNSHLKIKEHICSFCNNTYKNKCSLKSHLIKAHNNEKIEVIISSNEENIKHQEIINPLNNINNMEEFEFKVDNDKIVIKNIDTEETNDITQVNDTKINEKYDCNNYKIQSNSQINGDNIFNMHDDDYFLNFLDRNIISDC